MDHSHRVRFIVKRQTGINQVHLLIRTEIDGIQSSTSAQRPCLFQHLPPSFFAQGGHQERFGSGAFLPKVQFCFGKSVPELRERQLTRRQGPPRQDVLRLQNHPMQMLHEPTGDLVSQGVRGLKVQLTFMLQPCIGSHRIYEHIGIQIISRSNIKLYPASRKRRGSTKSRTL